MVAEIYRQKQQPPSLLHSFGINRDEGRRQQHLNKEQYHQELQKNLESYANEVLENQPVSVLYNYYFKNDESTTLYTNETAQPIHNAESQVDPQERNGYSIAGLQKLGNMLKHNPNQMTFWYSPVGDASFDKNPNNPYSHIKYNYGQLYLQYYDHEKVNAVAIKVSPQYESEMIKKFFPAYLPQAYNSQERQIQYFLENPQLLAIDKNYFLTSSPSVYTNIPMFDREDPITKQIRTYTLRDVFEEAKNRFDGKAIQNTFNFTLNDFDLKQNDVTQLYLGAIQRFMSQNNLKSTSLAGSCGGSTITSETVDWLMQASHNIGQIMPKDVMSILSSEYRKLSQDNHYEDYQCPHCHSTLKGEEKGHPENWKTQCPNCHGALGCGK